MMYPQTIMKHLLVKASYILIVSLRDLIKGSLKVKDYPIFSRKTSGPYYNNASGALDNQDKQKVSGYFKTDGGAYNFARLHSIAKIVMKNENGNLMHF